MEIHIHSSSHFLRLARRSLCTAAAITELSSDVEFIDDFVCVKPPPISLFVGLIPPSPPHARSVGRSVVRVLYYRTGAEGAGSMERSTTSSTEAGHS